MILRVLAGALFLVLGNGVARADTPTVHVVEPRSVGYFIGDVLTRDADVAVADDAKIDPASIPRPGPLNYWLELKSVDVDEYVRGVRKHYRIRLAYQTFYAPLEPRKLEIPAIRFRVLRPERESTQAVVPSWSFISSPLREIMPEKNGEGGPAKLLRADAPVSLSSTTLERTSMAIAGVTAVVALLLLAHHLALWPFHRRRRRPFTQAMRTVRREAAKAAQSANYRLALLALHRAFDEASQRRVLAEDLDSFLVARPEFESLRPDIERFFQTSRRAFFADDMLGSRAELPLSDLATFATSMSECERAVA
ncbi:MxaA protein [Candidatus Filomicrobium marinum]|uniref:MxaA protein n=1 Tax=Candidatus Filomicrobium marinum TaxID=1608628 RepID=A0A0D6JJV5_9HYPH|nr:hypothetical protein [Candidatus Filomicrobium marinum]CFX32574.1 MxaA protein [Candidatus Filomicrobium marinum]CPR21962.1 MxaA protein [Candidatus Filomicrobium marinum]